MQRSTGILTLIFIYQSEGQYQGRFGADEHTDQAAIFAHNSDKGFTTNRLSTQWLKGYFDAWRETSVLEGSPPFIELSDVPVPPPRCFFHRSPYEKRGV